MTFGDRLRAARTAQGLTQAELARKLGVSDAAVRMWELGHREPDLSMLTAIADALGVTVAELLGRPQEAAEPPWFQKLSPDLQAKLGDDRLRNAYFRILNKATLNDLPPETLEVIVESYLEARKLDEEARKARERKTPEGN